MKEDDFIEDDDVIDDVNDDEPSISRVVYTLGRLTKIWEYCFAMCVAR